MQVIWKKIDDAHTHSLSHSPPHSLTHLRTLSPFTQHAVIKIPNPKKSDEYRCNESVGGLTLEYDPTSTEISFSRKVLETYSSLGGFRIHYARIDLLNDEEGPLLMEAELLNPSVYANYIHKGAEFGRTVAMYFLSLLSNDTQSAAQWSNV